MDLFVESSSDDASSGDASNSASKSLDHDDTIDVIFVSLSFNILAGVLLTIVFMVCHKRLPWLVQPRIARPHPEETRKPPPEISHVHSLAWIKTMFSISEHDLIQMVGLEASLYLRFFRVGIEFFLFTTLLCCGVLLPIHGLSGHTFSNTFTFNELTIMNIDKESPVIWIHILFCYITTFVFLMLVRREYKRYTRLHHDYFLSNKHTSLRIEQLSLMIQDIPKHLQDDQKFDAYLREMYPDTLVNCVIIKQTPLLEQRCDERDKLHDEYEKALTKRQFLKRKSLAARKFPLRNAYGNMQKNVLKLRRQIVKMNQEIRSLQDSIGEGETSNCCAGFATFRSFEAATFASQVPLETEAFLLRARIAPEPRDICWKNLSLSWHARTLRFLLSRAMLAILVLVFGLIVTAFTNLLSIKTIDKYWPAVGALLGSNTTIHGFVSGLLPALVLIIIMKVLPKVIKAFVIFEGSEAFSYIEKQVLCIHFVFQFLHVFLVPALSKDMLLELDENSDEQHFFRAFTKSLIEQSTMFLSFLSTSTFLSMPLHLLRLKVFFKGVPGVRMSMSATSTENSTSPGVLNYGEYYPRWVIMFILGISYAQVAPIVLPFVLAFFIIGAIVMRYLVMYVYEITHESGGVLFPKAIARCAIGVVVAHAILIFILVPSSDSHESFALIPLPLITLAVYRCLQRYYLQPSKSLSKREIVELDRELRQQNENLLKERSDGENTDSCPEHGANVYCPPWQTADKVDVTRMIDNASKQAELINRLHNTNSVIGKLVLDTGTATEEPV